MPGAGGLVGGTAAAAGGPTIGTRCATVGPRSNGLDWVDVSGNAAVNRPGNGASEPATSPMVFKGIKHGGFARFWRETLCASDESRKGHKGLCS